MLLVYEAFDYQQEYGGLDYEQVRMRLDVSWKACLSNWEYNRGRILQQTI